MKKEIINVSIWRGNPKKDEKGEFIIYQVPKVAEGIQSVMEVLEYIYEHLDSSIAFYRSCRGGVCGGCWAMVNGKAALICKTFIEEDIELKPNCIWYSKSTPLIIKY